MVQDQLVEYVSSQLKLGISRDAVKSALAGAGWIATDVEDTLKKVEGANKPAAPATSSAPAVSSKPAYSQIGASSFTAPASGAAKSADQPSIKVSDLISASGSAMSFSNNSVAGQQGKMVQKTKAFVEDPMPASKTKRGLILKIVGLAVILGLGGFAGYLYFQNNDLAAKVATLGGASADVTSRVASLTGQVQALNASNTALAAEARSLTAENALLQANLSFAAVPLASSGVSTSSQTVSISGKLTAGKSSYTLTTSYGVLVFVQNAKDTKVDAALKPLLTSTSSVMLVGTHVPGSQYITVTAVNGSPL